MTDAQKQQILSLRQQGLSYAQIAAKVCVPVNTVKTHCLRHRDEARPPAITQSETGFCLNCRETLQQTPKRKPRKFCCDRCRQLWWNRNRLASQRGTQQCRCAHCGDLFVTRRNSGQRFCCHAHYIIYRFGEVPQG